MPLNVCSIGSSLSPFSEAFVLKGAMLFSLWAPTPYRATSDLDLLGFGDNAPARVAEIFRQVLEVESEDGVIFKPETLRAAAARGGRIQRRHIGFSGGVGGGAAADPHKHWLRRCHHARRARYRVSVAARHAHAAA
jgi:hypothetical protein